VAGFFQKFCKNRSFLRDVAISAASEVLMDRKIVPLVMSGGAGTRLWPASREVRPKQFLPLFGTRSTFQDTMLRVSDAALFERPIVVTNAAYRFMVLEQLNEIGIEADILLEPMRRDSGPAIAAGAAFAQTRDADALILALAADHVVGDTAAFIAACREGLVAADAGRIVTFGIRPERPATEYGYISPGDAVSGRVNAVKKFVEKPDPSTAAAYVKAGYFWNSGNFMFRAAVLLDEYRNVDSESVQAVSDAVAKAGRDLGFVTLDATSFGSAKAISIDYAVMEKTSEAIVVPLDAGWSDVGSWSALHEACDADAHGNVSRGDVIAEDSQGCYLYSESRLVAAVGLREHVVVETKDAVLVAPKDRVQDVKKLVSRLKEAGRYEHSLHREVFRPWGSYDSIENGERFQVKRLKVKPGATLSLQMHHHRAEHWIVVSGTARVTRGEEVFLLEENQSTYIPIGVRHRIENPGMIPLHIIEVQSGSYLGEDDIVRFDDRYGRK
jgi:mannose-1-phosphate guanylyltransferase/mannose-6-phosphate isomerase